MEQGSAKKWPTIEGACYLNNGWDFLIKSIYSYVVALQNDHLKLKTFDFAKQNEPIFEFKVVQIKEKFGSLRFYFETKPKEFNWRRYDVDNYTQKFNDYKCAIKEFVTAIERASESICEISGEQGKLRNVNGTFKTLSDKEFEKRMKVKEPSPCEIGQFIKTNRPVGGITK